MRALNCTQYSPQWIRARTGRITASRLADLLATLKSGEEAASRRNYRSELLAERLTGKVDDPFVSKEMRFGTEQEPYARTAYEIRTESMVDQVGFVFHPRFDFAGASPDGLIGDDGGLEVKCPKTTTHLAYVLAGTIPEAYRDQMLWNLACTERNWWDFVSYDPRLPKELRLFIVRLYRDDARIRQIELEVEKMNAEVNDVCGQLGAKPNFLFINDFVEENQPLADKSGTGSALDSSFPQLLRDSDFSLTGAFKSDGRLS